MKWTISLTCRQGFASDGPRCQVLGKRAFSPSPAVRPLFGGAGVGVAARPLCLSPPCIAAIGCPCAHPRKERRRWSSESPPATPGSHPSRPAAAHPATGDTGRARRDRPAGSHLRRASQRYRAPHGRGVAHRVLQNARIYSVREPLLVRAGVGWQAGVVGVATVGADLASPAGFALRTGKPVISNHLENEERFRTPEILQPARHPPRDERHPAG